MKINKPVTGTARPDGLLVTAVVAAIGITYMLPAAQDCAIKARQAAELKKAEFAYAQNIMNYPRSMREAGEIK